MKNKSIYFSILFISLVFNGLNAQQRISSYSDLKTSKWTVRTFNNDPLGVKIYTFNNGLQLITSTQTTSPRISTMVAVKTGSANDPSNHTGLAHYLEHMLFKGTDAYGTQDWESEKIHLATIDKLYTKYNNTTNEVLRSSIYKEIDSVSQIAAKFSIANEFDKMCQAMGASGTNAFTSLDMTCYVNEIPSNMLHKWVLLESERYRNPVLRLFHTELEAVYEEKNISLDNDNEKAQEAMYANLFPNHTYGTQTTIGTIEHLKNPNLQAIRDYFKTYYVPNNMAIIMAGDFNTDVAADAIAEHFGYLKPGILPTKTVNFGMPYGKPKVINLQGPDAENVTIGYRFTKQNPKITVYLKTLDLVLNNTKAGLLDLNLVKSQKVQSAYSSSEINKDLHSFTLSGKPIKGQSLKEVKELLLQQIENVKLGNFKDELLPAIVLNSEIDKLKGFKNNASRVYYLMNSFILETGYQKEFNLLSEMGKVTKQELMDFVTEYFTNDRVEVYKYEGKDTNVVKIEKPTINPVALNRDKQSQFVTNWLTEETNPITPKFIDFEPIKTQVVKNNLKLHCVKNETNKLFEFKYVLKQGTYHNLVWPIVTEYIQLAGTTTTDINTLSIDLYKIGCSFSAYSSTDNTFITITGPQENFAQAIKMLENILTNTKVDETILKGIIARILKNRENSKLNPKSMAGKLFAYAQYGAINPSTYQISKQKLETLTATEIVNKIKEIFKTEHEAEYFGPADLNTVANSINTEHAIALTWAAQPTKTVFTRVIVDKPKVYFVHNDQVQASIYWYGSLDKFNQTENTKIDAFNKYFGGDMSSVVFQNIRESKALAYSTFASHNTAEKTGDINYKIAFIGTQADKFTQAVNGMNELINELPKNAETFNLSKASLLNEMATSRVDNSNLFAIKRAFNDMGYSQDPNIAVYKEISNLQIEDVLNFHKTNWSNKPYILSVLGSKDKISNTQLSAFGEVNVLTLEQIFGY